MVGRAVALTDEASDSGKRASLLAAIPCTARKPASRFVVSAEQTDDAQPQATRLPYAQLVLFQPTANSASHK
jgi:hypothetical protein